MITAKSSVTDNSLWKASKMRLSLALSERRFLLASGDIVLLALAGAGALWGWSFMRPDIDFTLEFVLRTATWPLAMLLVWLVIASLSGIYDLRVAARMWGACKRILVTTLVLGSGYLLLFFISTTRDAPGDPLAGISWALPRVIPFFFLVITLVLLPLWRTFYAVVLTGSSFRRRALVLGAGLAGRTMVGALALHLQSDYEVLGFVDDDPEKQRLAFLDVPVLGTSADLSRLVVEQQVDELILAVTHGMGSEMFSAAMASFEQGVDLMPMTLLYEMATGKVPVEHIDSQWYVSLPTYTASKTRLTDWVQRMIDLFFAWAGLCLVLPFFPLIMLIIYCDSRGPVFYSQTRTGKNGHPFNLYKFRSMVSHAEGEGQAVWATEDDPRVTRFGKIMRKTRIDELPQIWNIVKGDMSLIGPRPERPEFIAELEKEIPFYRTRLVVKPGLTGWAQVRYKYGNTKEDALIKLQYDLYYIRHRSLWLNLAIIFKTVGVVLRFEGT
ncbi:MAG: sugar transferase [Anaerolineae bacterium]|nr:sugar transferase [Anaerolineae bacterium]